MFLISLNPRNTYFSYFIIVGSIRSDRQAADCSLSDPIPAVIACLYPIVMHESSVVF